MSAPPAVLQYPKPKRDTLNLVEWLGGNFKGETLGPAVDLLKQTDVRRKTLFNMLNNQQASTSDIKHHSMVEDCAAQYVAHWIEVVRIVSSSTAFCKAPKVTAVPAQLLFHWSGSSSLRIAERHGEELHDTCFRFETIMAYTLWGIACINYASMVETDPRSSGSTENLVIARNAYTRAANCFDLARQDLKQFRFAPKAFGTLAEMNDTILNSLYQLSLCRMNCACMQMSNLYYEQQKMGQSMYTNPSEWVKYVMRGYWGTAVYATDAFVAAQQMGGLQPRSELAHLAATTRQEHMGLFLQYKARLILQQQSERESKQAYTTGCMDRHEPMTSAYHFLNMSDHFAHYMQQHLIQTAPEAMRAKLSATCEALLKDNAALKQIISDANEMSISRCLLPCMEASFNVLGQLVASIGDDEQPQYLFEDDLTDAFEAFKQEIGLTGEAKASEPTVTNRSRIAALPRIIKVPQLKTISDAAAQSKTVTAAKLVPPVVLSVMQPKAATKPVAKEHVKAQPPKVQVQAPPTIVVADDEDWPDDENPDEALRMYLPNAPTHEVTTAEREKKVAAAAST